MTELVAAAGGLAGALWLLSAMKTGNANLDRLGVRGRLALYSLLKFGPGVLLNPSIPRALMCIVNNESGGRPSQVLGDTAASGGPSVGLMQIYRTTAVDLGLWTPPAGASVDAAKQAYAELAQNEAQGIRWGVAVFAAKLRLAKGNIPDAIRRYNGSGHLAEAYKQRALDFAGVRGWSLTS